MIGLDEGNMLPLLSSESIGGNAGSYEKFPCIAANFYYEQNNGKIIYFGNFQNVPINIRSKYPEATFRLAFNPDNCKNRIIDLFDFESITNIAKKNMEQTISIYNEVYGF